MIDWNQIETVLLDMDGTLLDLNFDTYFWSEHVPRRYAGRHQLSLEEAKGELYPRFRAREGTIDWYCIDFWSDELGLDIAMLKQEVDHLIAVHPRVFEFLDSVRASGRRTVLVTNAHSKSLELKMERTGLGDHLDRIICSHDYGLPKEQGAFWDHLQQDEPFKPGRTLLVDDSLAVLRSARNYGIRWLLAVLKPDSQQPLRTVEEFDAIAGFHQIHPNAKAQ